MKVIGFAMLFASVFAQAAPRATTWTNLSNASRNHAALMQASSGCSFTARVQNGLLTLTLRNQSQGWLQFRVAPSHSITLEHPNVYHDGSYHKVFRIAGQGMLRLVHADDAFDHAYMTSGTKTISCEVDF